MYYALYTLTFTVLVKLLVSWVKNLMYGHLFSRILLTEIQQKYILFAHIVLLVLRTSNFGLDEY